jgi:putative spermidine/putrescine transport system substrate-binding protein
MNKSFGPVSDGFAPSRRGLLRAAATAVPALALPFVRKARAADQKVVIRTTTGGTYGDANEQGIFAPFTKATGIVVEKTPVGIAPLIASAKQGKPLVDVIDTSETLLETMSTNDALAAIDYGRFKMFSIDDIGKESAQPAMVRRMVAARVLGYRKSVFSKTPAPKSWAEFWDTKKFPAVRALPGFDLDVPDLEFALLGDGVAMDKLYPIDLSRALASYSKIRPNIHTFYGTDAISTSLLSSGEVELEPIANGRIQPMIDEGGDYALEWNQHMKVPGAFSIMKGAQNLENAYRFIDFALSPEVQAKYSTLIPYGPINKKSFAFIPEPLANKLPSNPKWSDQGFTMDAKWWGGHMPEVTKAWNDWSAAK